MRFGHILSNVADYYTDRVKTYGETAKGVDWNSTESQMLRFEQLLKLCETSQPFSINDYGCGYGALVDYLLEHEYSFEYQGFDISEEMTARAQARHRGRDFCEFTTDSAHLRVADYTVASGIFNVKGQVAEHVWMEYCLATLNDLAEISQRGFSFNALTKYSDPERMRADLYYADPLFLFDYCKQRFSRFVALLHDYPLYEFTILVRKVG